MKVIYCCQTGALASVVAAAIHLGRLPVELPATVQELDNLAHFHGQSVYRGSLAYMGVDGRNHRIYAMEVENDKHLVTRIAESFAGLYGIPPQEMRLVDVERLSGSWLEMVARLLGMLGITKLQKKIILRIIQKNYSSIVDQVKKVLAD